MGKLMRKLTSALVVTEKFPDRDFLKKKLNRTPKKIFFNLSAVRQLMGGRRKIFGTVTLFVSRVFYLKCY